MNLYKVVGFDTRFIIAITPQKAMEKFLEVTEHYSSKTIECSFICEREAIIPTVEPSKEFKDHIPFKGEDEEER